MSGFVPPFPKPPERRQSRWQSIAALCTDQLKLFCADHYRMKMSTPWFPGQDMFVVNDASLIRRILVEKSDRYPKSPVVRRLLARTFFRDGIFESTGDAWELRRRMIEPAFDERSLEDLFPLMLDCVNRFIETLEQHPEGQTIDADEAMAGVSADIIFRMLFSKPISQEDADKVYEVLFQSQSIMAPYSLAQSLPVIRNLNIFGRRMARYKKTLENIMERQIRPRFEAHQRGVSDQPRDFLNALISATDPETGYRYSLDELVGEVTGLFVAGHETTGSILAWALYLISECPDVQTQLQREARSVFRGRPPKHGDVRKLKLARDVFRETLRLYPPVILFFREPLEPDEFRKAAVCPHALVVVSPWLMQRHHSHWERPNEFDPFRYATDKGKSGFRSAYLPFNIGPRTCMGASIAMQEGAIVLAMLAERFHFRPDPNRIPIPAARMTLRATNGIHLFASPSSDANDSSVGERI